MSKFTCDGNLRVATMEDIKPGVLLRRVNSDGSTPPFSDVVVMKTYIDHGEPRFDVGRPFAFSHYGGELHGVEKITYLGEKSLTNYHLILLASGEPYTCILDR